MAFLFFPIPDDKVCEDNVFLKLNFYVYVPTHQPTYLLTHPPTNPPTYLLIPTYSPTHPPTYTSTYPSTYPPTYLATYPHWKYSWDVHWKDSSQVGNVCWELIPFWMKHFQNIIASEFCDKTDGSNHYWKIWGVITCVVYLGNETSVENLSDRNFQFIKWAIF